MKKESLPFARTQNKSKIIILSEMNKKENTVWSLLFGNSIEVGKKIIKHPNYTKFQTFSYKMNKLFWFNVV